MKTKKTDAFYTTSDGADYSTIPVCCVRSVALTLHPVLYTELELCVRTNRKKIKITDIDYSSLGQVLSVRFESYSFVGRFGFSNDNMVIKAVFNGILDIHPGDKVRIRRNHGTA